MFEFNGVTKFLAFAIVILSFVRVIYSFIIKNWNYFSERGIVCYERGMPVFGTLLGSVQTLLGKKSLPEYSQDLYQKYSDRKFFGMYDMGGRPSLLIRDPDLINKVSIKDFDHFLNHFFQLDKNLDPIVGRTLFAMSNQKWRDMRSTLSPLYTGSKMRYMLTLINEKAQGFNEFIRQDILSTSSTKKSREYDMTSLLMRLSNDIIASTAFGLEISTLKDPDNEFLKMGQEIAYAIVGLKSMILPAFPKVAAFFKLKILNDRHDEFFRNAMKSTIEERQKKKIVRNDMLNLLLLAKEGKLNEIKEVESDQDTGFATVSEFMSTKTNEKLKNWTEEDLLAQCIVFFLAGFAGLTKEFCFLCHEMSANPDIQQRLYDEIAETHEQLNGKQLTYETLQKMKYLDMVISEVLRKWPVVGLIDRSVTKQYLMEDNDATKILLQPNDVIWFSIYAIHRDPNYYPNPDAFDPERFSNENKKHIRSGTYLPFGIGPRACIASRLVLLQMKALIYHILLEFKIECSPNTHIPLKLRGGSTNVDSEFFNQFTLRN